MGAQTPWPYYPPNTGAVQQIQGAAVPAVPVEAKNLTFAERNAPTPIASACLACFTSKIRCDFKRPCGRCVKRGVGHECQTRKYRRRKKPVQVACFACVKSKAACDDERPCTRCKRAGRPCEDRSTKRKSDTSISDEHSESDKGSVSSLDTNISISEILTKFSQVEVSSMIQSPKLFLFIALLRQMSTQTFQTISSDLQSYMTRFGIDLSYFQQFLELPWSIPEEMKIHTNVPALRETVDSSELPSIAFWFPQDEESSSAVEIKHYFNDSFLDFAKLDDHISEFTFSKKDVMDDSEVKMMPFLKMVPEQFQKTMCQALSKFLFLSEPCKKEANPFPVKIQMSSGAEENCTVIPSMHEGSFLILSFKKDSEQELK